MLHKFKIIAMAIFILSVAFINLWNYFKLNATFEGSPPDKVQKFISRNFLIDEYSFFSPGIADTYSISFLTKDASTGKVKEIPLYFDNAEMQNKIFSVSHKFYTYSDIRDYVAYSFASYFFQQNEHLSEAIFCFSQYKLPESKEYYKGKKPYKALVYAREYFNQ